MLIIGAGLAGLLAVNLMRYRNPTIIEKQKELPNNHSAVLRFRSSIISDVTGIPFKKVQVIKATLPWLNPVADALAYSEKNNMVLRSDRSIPMEVTSSERYIAPPDLISLLATGIDIKYNNDGLTGWKNNAPIISTIPMPALMAMLDYPKIPHFPSVPGCNILARVERCDAYVSLYVPSPDYPFSRISLMGDELIAECPFGIERMNSVDVFMAADLLGINKNRIHDIEMRHQTYAKILPIDEVERTRFIAWATDNHGVYSLGRYACWRPALLLDDLVKDIRLIEKWNVSNYTMRKQR